nr:MAG TPA: hypothetical protein [Bacteriophage sp.]
MTCKHKIPFSKQKRKQNHSTFSDALCIHFTGTFGGLFFCTIKAE